MRYISCDIEDNVAIVQINNPPVNELSVQVIKGLDKTLDLLSEKNDIKVIIITGKGRGFCTGVDIKEIGEKGYQDAWYAAFAQFHITSHNNSTWLCQQILLRPGCMVV